MGLWDRIQAMSCSSDQGDSNSDCAKIKGTGGGVVNNVGVGGGNGGIGGISNYHSSRNVQIAVGDDSNGDLIAEKLIEIIGITHSRDAYFLARYLLMRDFSLKSIKKLVETMEGLQLSRRKRRRVSKLVRGWAKSYSVTAEGSGGVNYPSFFGSLEQLISSPYVYKVANKLIYAQQKVAVPWLENSLKEVADSADVFSELPPKIRRVFYEIVEDSIKLNGGRHEGERRQYNNLGKIIRSLNNFIGSHNPLTYDLVRKVKERDKRNILFQFYYQLGRVPAVATQRTIDVIDLMLDYVPEDSVMADGIVKKIYQNILVLCDSFERHRVSEVEALIELRVDFFEESKEKLLDSFVKLESDLRRSNEYRRNVELSQGVAVVEEDVSLEQRIDNIGFEYLKLSAELYAASCFKKVDDLARRVVSFNRLKLSSSGSSWLLDAITLYKKGIIDNFSLSSSETETLRSIVRTEREDATVRREVERTYDLIIKKGPVLCEHKLRTHLKNLFEVDVTEVWDFRNYQDRLYWGNSAEPYIQLTANKTNPEFVASVVKQLADQKMLEKNIYLLGGGCGHGLTEIMFYNSLIAEGFDVRMGLIDKSPIMRGEAAINCSKAMIDVDIYPKDLEALTLKDLRQDRQVLFTLWGGTFFNWKNRYEVAKNIHSIFSARDTKIDGSYIVDRYHYGADRKKDVFLVQGDLKKDKAYYEGKLSKLFLARGLYGGYDLTPDVLMRDGQWCHTVYFNEEFMELQCVYLIIKNKGVFKKNQAILVIDSGTLHKEGFTWDMASLDFDCGFVEGGKSQAVAYCLLNENCSASR